MLERGHQDGREEREHHTITTRPEEIPIRLITT
jgi:hypothetical protein